MTLGRVAIACALVGAVPASALVQACLFDVPELGSSDAGDAAYFDAAAEATPLDASAEPDGCPPGMVRTPLFCIDATEVTGRAYYEFMRAATDAGRMPSHPRCGFVITWQPDMPAEDDRPVVNVNWCQAFEYCKYVGKRLCGRVGGGVLLLDERSTPDHDEWYMACAGGVGQNYCYGSFFRDGACNVGGPDREPVRQRLSCEGAYTGLYDLSGNVSEFFDACDEVDGGGADDSCAIRAPGYETYGETPEVASTCLRLDGLGRSRGEPYLGFRCCATPAQ